VDENTISRAGENWKRRWDEAMLWRASQVPAAGRNG
jgi:hypothetical protein